MADPKSEVLDLEGEELEGLSDDDIEQLTLAETPGDAPQEEPEAPAAPEANPEPESPEPEKEAEGSGDAEETDTSKPPQGHVPIQALHQARNEIKQQRERLQQLEQFAQAVQQRLQKPEQPEQQPEPEKPFEEDPIAWAHRMEQRERQRAAEAHQQAEQQQQTQQARAQEDVVLENVAQFRQSAEPETASAIDAIMKGNMEYIDKMIERGEAHPSQRGEILRQSVLQFAYQAPQDMNDVKDYVLRHAAFWGYRPEVKSNTDDGVEKLARMSKAQSAAKTLSGGGTGGDAAKELSVADLEKMTGGDLDNLALDDIEALEEALGRLS
jgi:hypothetical protein